MSTLLDTNILARLAQPDHLQHVIARDAVKVLLEGGERLCSVPQNLYEFWAVATRPIPDNGLGMLALQAQREIAQMRRIFTVCLDERGVFPHWERLVAAYEVKGKTTYDARLVAAMYRHGMERLLTFNVDHFKRFVDITVISPDALLRTL